MANQNSIFNMQTLPVNTGKNRVVKYPSKYTEKVASIYNINKWKFKQKFKKFKI